MQNGKAGSVQTSGLRLRVLRTMACGLGAMIKHGIGVTVAQGSLSSESASVTKHYCSSSRLSPSDLSLTRVTPHRFATAYAITKALLPLRLMLSVWATPWFASRALAPLTSLYSRLRPAKASSGVAAAGNQAAKASPAGGTNAIGGRVLEASRVQ